MDNNKLVIVEGGNTIKALLRILNSLAYLYSILKNVSSFRDNPTHTDITDKGAYIEDSCSTIKWNDLRVRCYPPL